MPYESMSELGFQVVKQGAEAKLWSGTLFGMKCLAKERFPKKYRHPELDEIFFHSIPLQIFNYSFQTIGDMQALSKKGILAPAVLFLDLERNVLFLEEIPEARTMSSVIETRTASVSDLGSSVGEIVGLLHRHGIIHGDLTTSNLLLDPDQRLYIIDFGLSEASTAPMERAVDLYVLERAVTSAHPGISQDFLKAVFARYKEVFPGGESTFPVLREVRSRGRKRDMVG
ncbi:unnamed protein product [Notodromas monacha]|uniref:non-specific serine/threonine protein kinase n=1 Tax=Notodromas monacha TaxID=399045 RepID=A0A7R9BUM8_9CRUS|nr:unnamed protein product [Notodromas monacha]CAG0920447.1 unnamed protein product [Notodromas monacha]